MLEPTRVNIHVETELVVLHVQRLNVLIERQALKDGTPSNGPHSAVLQRDNLVVEHGYELLNGHNIIFAARLHVLQDTSALHKRR